MSCCVLFGGGAIASFFSIPFSFFFFLGGGGGGGVWGLGSRDFRRLGAQGFGLRAYSFGLLLTAALHPTRKL